MKFKHLLSNAWILSPTISARRIQFSDSYRKTDQRLLGLEFGLEADVALPYAFQSDYRCCGCRDSLVDLSVASFDRVASKYLKLVSTFNGAFHDNFAEDVMPCDQTKPSHLSMLDRCEERFLMIHKTFSLSPCIVIGFRASSKYGGTFSNICSRKS